jgi:hypothetical protein
VTYDQWKTDSGYDEYDDYDAERECDHEEHQIDILTGRAECCMCPHSWYVSGDEITREIERQATYYEDIERQERRQWWLDKTYPVRMFLHRLLMRVWPRKSLSVLTDDEIPF